MSALFNYHTHTNLCDGRDTPENVVLSAIALGMETIGFSGHAPTEGGERYCMKSARVYRDVIARLKDKYSHKIRILCGIERDIYSYDDDGEYDYVLGAVHSIEYRGEHFEVDASPERFAEGILSVFGGDGDAFAIAYMKKVASVAEITGCDIVAHFDLVSKFNSGNKYFNEQNPEYIARGLEAIETITKTCPVFEINTGAISRGWKTTPYPSPVFLEKIKSVGGKVTFGSDSHRSDTLLCCFEEAEKLALQYGFGGFVRVDIDR